MSRAVIALLFAALSFAQEPKRILYVTHSAGFRHDSIVVSRDVLRSLNPRLKVTPTEDLAQITAENLRNYDAVFFFTSGELDLRPEQRTALLDFVRRGGGFGGVHSATDTLYTWPEYGELIGGYFDGHPWVQSVRIDIEDPDHPAAAHLTPGFDIVEEIYQFRNLSRDRVRVLMSLNPMSVDLNAPGVHPNTEDFPLAWVRTYGEGRVFYSALGHFDDTWRDRRFQRMLEGALLWMTRLADAPADPRPTARPVIQAAGNAATGRPERTVASGSLISIYGQRLTPGSALAGPYLNRLAGATVRYNGTPIPLLYAAPGQINAYLPRELRSGQQAELIVTTASGISDPFPVTTAGATPGVFAVTTAAQAVTLWATGLGATPQFTPDLNVRIGNQPARVLFAGPSPEFLGLEQINLEIPSGIARGAQPVEVSLGTAAPFFAGSITLP